jgi:FtsP/CotA-like multicopper oxidase with cupredoxin domain
MSGAAAAGFSLGGRGQLRHSDSSAISRFQLPLSIPPLLRPSRVEGGGDYYEIEQRQARIEILPGKRTTVWGYQGMMPGPTIRVRQGRKAVIRHVNKLSVPTVVHLHGASTPADSDGFPTDVVMPGNSRTYVYPNEHAAATLWYHDHVMDYTGRNLFMGLAGLYLVEDDREQNLPLPRDQYDVPLIVQDRRFDRDAALQYSPDPVFGAITDTILVNGVPWPRFEVSARRYRFRILNGSNARAFLLALSSGQPFVQIATDGGLLPAPIKVKEIPLAMAERVEVIVDFSSYPIGTQLFLQDSTGAGESLLRFDIVRKERDDSAMPAALALMQNLSAERAVRVRTLVFTRGASTGTEARWAINGREFDADHPIAAPGFNDIEIWRILNHTFHEARNIVHPVHLHLVNFQILERNGKPPLVHEKGWKDTVALTTGEEVRIIARFGGYRGRYLLHCHNLEHEDRGMMARFDVV